MEGHSTNLYQPVRQELWDNATSQYAEHLSDRESVLVSWKMHPSSDRISLYLLEKDGNDIDRITIVTHYPIELPTWTYSYCSPPLFS